MNAAVIDPRNSRKSIYVDLRVQRLVEACLLSSRVEALDGISLKAILSANAIIFPKNADTFTARNNALRGQIVTLKA